MENIEIVGLGASEKLSDIIRKFNFSTFFIVRGRQSYVSSGAEIFINTNISRNCVTEFFDFSVNPKFEDVENGLELFKSKGHSAIIAIGGGSVIDMAKLIRFFYSFKGSIEDGCYTQINDIIPLIAIPTTAGTGSEVTQFAVVYKHNIKYSVENQMILPNFAIVDPIFTYNYPKYLTACSGIDALSQSIESYWNIHSTEESERYAIEAIQCIWHSLPSVIQNNSEPDRVKLTLGSYLAGKAINLTKTTAVHAMSYPFTTYYGYPHGHAVALSLPFFMQYNYLCEEDEYRGFSFEYHNEKMENIFKIIGVDNALKAKKTTIEFIQRIGLNFDLPSSFDVNVIVAGINDKRVSNNPRFFSGSNVYEVIADIQKY